MILVPELVHKGVGCYIDLPECSLLDLTRIDCAKAHMGMVICDKTLKSHVPCRYEDKYEVKKGQRYDCIISVKDSVFIEQISVHCEVEIQASANFLNCHMAPLFF